MADAETSQPMALLTRREAAAILGVSMRTVSRRISDGTLETRLRSNGVRGILWSSVMALRDADTPATETTSRDQSNATDVAQDVVSLAVAYGRLAQAVRTHLDAGWTARRRTRDELRTALEEVSTMVPLGEVVGGDAKALPAPPPNPSTEVLERPETAP